MVLITFKAQMFLILLKKTVKKLALSFSAKTRSKVIYGCPWWGFRPLPLGGKHRDQLAKQSRNLEF